MNKLTYEILCDLVKLLSAKEAVLLCDPKARVERVDYNDGGSNWVGYVEDDQQVRSSRGSDDCWRILKICVLESLNRMWTPESWKEPNIFALSDRMKITKAPTKKPLAPSIKKSAKVMSEWAARQTVRNAKFDVPKMSKAEHIAAEAARKLRNKKAREAYAAKKARKVVASDVAAGIAYKRIDKATGARSTGKSVGSATPWLTEANWPMPA